MISPTAINTIVTCLRTPVELGLLSKDEVREARKLLSGVATSSAGQEHEQLLKVAEVARRLNCSSRTILRMAAQGLLERVHLVPGSPKSLRFRAGDVETVMKGGAA